MADYKLLYFSEIQNARKQTLRLEILKLTDGQVEAQELLLAGEEPIVIEYDADGNIFKPLIQSSCTVKVITSDPLLTLYTGKINEIMCKVYKNDDLFWFGYLTPNVYNSTYDIGYNTLELEFVDVIAQLDNLKFKKTGVFSSFLSLLNNSINRVDITNIIQNIYFQNDIRIDIAQMGCLERNFIDETGDEEDGAMTYKEMLESILLWLNKSLIFFNNSLYILDLLNVKDYHSFLRYSRNNNTATPININVPIRTLNSIGVAENDCTISLGNVYNKVTVVASNNPIDNVIPDMFDSSKFKSLMQDGTNYIRETTTEFSVETGRGAVGHSPNPEEHTMLNAFFYNPDWNMTGTTHDTETEYVYQIPTANKTTYKATFDENGNCTDKVELQYDGTIESTSDFLGTITLVVYRWYINDTATEYTTNFNSFFTLYMSWFIDDDGYIWVNAYKDNDGNYVGGTEYTLHNVVSNAYNKLGFCMYADLPGQDKIGDRNHITRQNIPYIIDAILIQKYYDWKTADGEPASIDWKTCFSMISENAENINWMSDMGKMYMYYGDLEPSRSVTLLADTQFVGQGGYFIISMKYMFSNVFAHANTCFRFPDEKYGTVLKYGKASTGANFRDDIFRCELSIGNKYYNGTTWTSEKSYFNLRHANHSGDKIFGEEKTIDNTVRFDWGLADSSEGYAIKLPENEMLSGKINFTLYADSRLGGGAQVPHAGFISEYGDAKNYHGYDGNKVSNATSICSINISELSLIYTTADTVKDVYNLEEYDADVTFTNVVDSEYITKFDDLELTTNTYTPYAVSYSYVLKKLADGGTEYVKEIDGKKQEERLIEKYVLYYSKPKLIYENIIKDSDITPFSIIHLNKLNKNMIPTNLKYDLKRSKVGVQLNEI